MHVMLSFACFCCLFAVGAARTVTITFVNKCPAKLSVTGHKGELGTEPKLDIPACANLQPSKQCSYTAATDYYQFFADHGWRTTAKFFFDSRTSNEPSVKDTMQISINGGFDHPMRITSTKTSAIADCPAKNNCDQWEQEVSIGGAFTVTFCPTPIKK